MLIVIVLRRTYKPESRKKIDVLKEYFAQENVLTTISIKIILD